jgi:hypothetical protein
MWLYLYSGMAGLFLPVVTYPHFGPPDSTPPLKGGPLSPRLVSLELPLAVGKRNRGRMADAVSRLACWLLGERVTYFPRSALRPGETLHPDPRSRGGRFPGFALPQGAALRREAMAPVRNPASASVSGAWTARAQAGNGAAEAVERPEGADESVRASMAQ